MKGFPAACAAVLLLGEIACSSSPDHPAVAVPGGTGGVSGASDGSPGDAASSGGADDGGTDASRGGAGPGDLGGLEVVDVDVGGDCVAPGGTAVPVVQSDEAGTTFTRTGTVGSRRYAFGADSNVLMTFAPDGTAPSPIVVGPAAVTTDGSSLTAFVLDPIGANVARYDALAAPAGSAVEVETAITDAPSVAVGPLGTIVAYRSSGYVRGSVVSGGTVSGTFQMAPGSGGEGRAQTACTADADGFGVVYCRHQHDGTTRTTWARIGADGTILLAKTLLLANGNHILIDLLRREGGYLAILGEGNPTRATVLVELDDFGNIVPPARRLLGTGLAFGGALGPSGLAVAAALEDGRAAVRIFDASLEPAGPWICVDDSEPGSGFYAQAGVAADGAGWGIVARMTDLSARYRRTNSAGTGAP